MATTFIDAKPFSTVRAATVRQTPAPASLYQCLILSAQDERCRWFDAGAEQSGWETVICQDKGQAAFQLARHRFPLVIVDLEGADAATVAEFRETTEQLARQGGCLLMVCGGEDDPMQEIWARSLGAWIYLSGVDSACDLEMVCGEARTVADKVFPHLAEQVRRWAHSA